MSFGKILIFGFFFGIVGFIAVMGMQDYRRQVHAHDHYKPVDAVITTSKLEIEPKTNGRTSISAHIGYSYMSDGQRYTGWRYAYVSPEINPSEQVKRYPLNTRVTAYVDPGNPAEAILYNTVTPVPEIVSWFIAPLIIGVWGCFLHFWLERGATNRQKS